MSGMIFQQLAASYCCWAIINKTTTFGELINLVDYYDHGHYHSMIGRPNLIAKTRQAFWGDIGKCANFNCQNGKKCINNFGFGQHPPTLTKNLIVGQNKFLWNF